MKEKLLCVLEKHAEDLKYVCQGLCRLVVDDLIIYINKDLNEEYVRETTSTKKYFNFFKATVKEEAKIISNPTYNLSFLDTDYLITKEEYDNIFDVREKKLKILKDEKDRPKIEQLNKLC